MDQALFDHIDNLRSDVMGEIRQLRGDVSGLRGEVGQALTRIAVIEARCAERCALAKKNGNGTVAFVKQQWPLIWRVSLLAAALVGLGLGGVETASAVIAKFAGG
jgi:hypothetical protein